MIDDVMIVSPMQAFLASLENRRKRLGMPWDALAVRSGASRASVCRLLQKHHRSAGFQNLLAVAEALGVPAHFADGALTAAPIDIDDFLDRQAERQAKKLVGMVQGTMGLEAQAVAQKRIRALVRSTKQRLLAGPKKKLWYD